MSALGVSGVMPPIFVGLEKLRSEGITGKSKGGGGMINHFASYTIVLGVGYIYRARISHLMVARFKAYLVEQFVWTNSVQNDPLTFIFSKLRTVFTLLYIH